MQAIRRDAQSISQQDILNGMERILQVWHGLEWLPLLRAGPTHKLPVSSHWSLMLACHVQCTPACTWGPATGQTAVAHEVGTSAHCCALAAGGPPSRPAAPPEGPPRPGSARGRVWHCVNSPASAHRAPGGSGEDVPQSAGQVCWLACVWALPVLQDHLPASLWPGACCGPTARCTTMDVNHTQGNGRPSLPMEELGCLACLWGSVLLCCRVTLRWPL